MEKKLKNEVINNFLSHHFPKVKNRYNKIKCSNKLKDNFIINKNYLITNQRIIFNTKSRKKGLFEIIVFIIIIYISLSKKPLYFANSMEEIILKVNGPGTIKILSDEFRYLPNEVEINGIKNTSVTSKSFYLENNINTIKIYYITSPISLRNMFKSLNSITEVDLSNFDTSNVNDMTNMFQNCGNLEYLNLNNLNTSSVTSMDSMFQNCAILKTLDLSSFHTSKVNSMKNMFNNCANLENLNISNFDTSSVLDMSKMFSYCKKIETIDISNFKTSNTNMNEMFNSCYKLKTLKLPNEYNVLSCSNMGKMFNDCQALKYLDLSSFNTTTCTNMEYLFYNCKNLVNIHLSNLITSSVESLNNMFASCSQLESLDLSNFDTSSIINMGNMFENCRALIYLNLKSFIINDNTNIENMFKNFATEKICFTENANLINSKFPDLNNICSDQCFSESNKLISELKICVEDCSLYDTYKYEYNNKCYKDNCPNETEPSSNNQYICIKKLICPNFYNMDKTKCFNNIPDGYYLNNSEQHLIDKCHENCKTCNKKEIEGNNNCLTCKENLFFDNGNCLINCTYGSFIDNNNAKICNCNDKCKECSIENNNLCKSCKEGYHPKYENRMKIQ